MVMNEKRRVQVFLSEPTIAEIQKIADEKQLSLSGAVRLIIIEAQQKKPTRGKNVQLGEAPK